MSDERAAEQPGTDVLGHRPPGPLPGAIRLAVVSGPDQGRSLPLSAGVHVIGKDPSCSLVLRDTSVSRRHLEIVVLADAVELRDLGSTNGSFIHGASFDVVRVAVGTSVVIGQTQLQIVAPSDALDTSAPASFGQLLGHSEAMRRIFAILESVSRSDVSILIEGETGTGKELAAEGIHGASLRSSGPFVVCDLAAVPRSVIESELFGHVRGAFTGADRDRQGAFAQADGGTIFLDEVGELDTEAQPRLLRALERRQVKPVGGTSYRPVDVRVIAATNRNLAAEVKAGRFREDLYHRLAVVRLALPPLRERRDDIPLLVESIVSRAAASSKRAPPLVPPGTLALLASHDWPGNVRELRNVLERAMSLAPDAPAIDPNVLGLDEGAPPSHDLSRPAADATVQFKEAKERLVQAWERDYVEALLTRAEGNVTLAARQAGIDRVYLHRLMKKHRLGG